MTKWSGNHFVMTKENGIPVWYWEDKVGSQCGRERKWRYEVQKGDSVNIEAGVCPSGDTWSEMEISGAPKKV